jgi:phosphoribosylglycinamide formyltransferase-1
MAALRGVSSDRWEIARFAGNNDKREPENDVERTQGGQVLNIGWFSTGRDKAARQLLQTVQDSIRSGDINGEISFVFSNREPGEAKESDTFFELVQSYNFRLVCSSHKELKTTRNQNEWRIKYDREVNKKIKSFACDVCVLAGYMLIVSEELCKRHDMINLHPAPQVDLQAVGNR